MSASFQASGHVSIESFYPTDPATITALRDFAAAR
jgi:hypothetical protein